MTPPDGSEDDTATGGSMRIQEGFLNLRKAKENKKRWVVFQGDKRTGIFQLKVFKNSDEKTLKISYTVTKDTFVGTERGVLQASKSNQKPGQTATYLAILLVTVTLVFEEITAKSLTKWQSAIKKYFDSNSWDVVPMTGVSLPESPVVLHITQNALSLATTNPPKHCRRWALGRVADYGIWGARFYFHLDSSESNKGYIEMRASTPDEANSIGDVLIRLLPHLGSRTERKTSLGLLVPGEMSSEKFTGAPVSPRRKSKPDHPDNVVSGGREKGLGDQTVFTFPSSPPPPLSSISPDGPPPPPVSPRPPSALTLTLKLPQAKCGSSSSPKLTLASPRSPARRKSQPSQ